MQGQLPVVVQCSLMQICMVKMAAICMFCLALPGEGVGTCREVSAVDISHSLGSDSNSLIHACVYICTLSHEACGSI